MATEQQTYWVFKDNYPAKRFIGDGSANKAKTFAEQLAITYPGSVVRCSVQILYEADIFTIQPSRVEPAKELHDA